MADYTEQQLKDAARRALDAGDLAAARRLIAAARQAAQAAPRREPGPEQGPPMPPEVQLRQLTQGIQIPPRSPASPERLVPAFGAGAARGAAELVGLPGTLLDLADTGARAAGLLSGEAPRTMTSGQSIRGGLERMTGGATEYRDPSVPGRIAGTVGEFYGGGAGGKAAMLGGTASELAGMATEGTLFEPAARIAAGIAAPAAAARIPSVGGVSPVRTQMTDTLRQAGVQPTAGQARGSDLLRSLEGATQPTGTQREALTRAVMRSLGSTDDVATRETIKAAGKAIGDKMDEALEGVSFVPNNSLAQAADDVASEYMLSAPAATVIPRVRSIVEEIQRAARNGDQIDLTRLREWRTALGRMTISKDEPTRKAAKSLRDLIDGATDAALLSAGRTDQIAALTEARTQWRNYLAVSDASTRGGAEAGILSPAELNQSVIRVTGRQSYARGGGTDLAELSSAAADVLRPLPTVSPGGVRDVITAPFIGVGAGGAGLAIGADPAMAGLLALGGVALPAAARMAARSRPVQAALMDPMRAAIAAGRTAPGLLAQ